jgi:hypothetical protein
MSKGFYSFVILRMAKQTNNRIKTGKQESKTPG